MAPAKPSTRNFLGLFALLGFLCLTAGPVSGGPGTPFALTVKKSETEPMVGVNCYVFNGAGSYLGMSGTSNAGGTVSFNLPDGVYKFRVDYLGYQFWSEIHSFPTSLSGTFAIPHQDVVIRVEGLDQGAPEPMQGLNAYLFTSSGSYLGQFRVTNSSGEVIFSLPDRSYKVRVDHFGRQFWSEVFQWQNTTVTIPMGDSEVTVTGSGLPLAGVKIYVFSATGSYLGISRTTDSNGKAGFSLPAGSYKYRADYQASQYWSGEEPLVAYQTNPVAISTGGGSFALTVMKNDTEPLVGVNCYVYNGAGSYLGMSGTSNTVGAVSLNLSNGTYKFRVDYLGYQYWSEIYSVPTSLSGIFTIPHEDVVVRVEGLNQGSPDPMQGLNVYLFTASGSYLGQSLATNSNGEVIFSLPDQPYKVRADYLGQQFWSEPFTWQDKTVTIPMGDSEVTVTGSGLPLAGVKVYVFSASGSYLGISGTTDSIGKVVFTLPAGSYKYRADYQASQYGSGVASLVAGQRNPVAISTGGGSFTLTVQRGPADPLTGVNCYLFNGAGSYLGMSATSNTVGAVSFNLSDGTYKFRMDYLGYQFWSEIYSVPMSLAGTLTILHQDVVFSVVGVNQGPSPMAGVPVYLFTGSSAYLGQSLLTDSNGQVTFSLPEQAYKVRADYLGQEFWSEAFTWQNATVSIPTGDAEVTVTSGGNPLARVPVYVFSAAGAYLGVSGTTDGNGKVSFTLPAGTYKFRADHQGNQYWSGEETLIAGQINAVALSTGGGLFSLTVMKNETEPLVAVNCYVFNEGGSYLGISGIADGAGKVSLDLSDGLYKFRVDYLGYPFWSEIHLVPASFSAILTIPHQDTVIRVEAANHGAPSPIAGLSVYLFTSSGSYLGQSLVTNSNGEVIFSLPDQPYNVRADYLGQQYWSEIFQWQNVTVTIPMGDSEVTITHSGIPLAGVNVYGFSADGAYLGVSGVTDGNGKVFFTLPAGTYKFRADYQGNQYWSGESTLLAGQVNPIQISETVQVPGVVGLSLSVAETAITGAGLTVGIIAGEHSGTVPEGWVINQNPVAGSSAQQGFPVDLVVSLGPEALPLDEFKLWASDGAQYDAFGNSVSLNGDYALVGAPFANESMGAAYVFKWDGTTWTQVAKLTAADAGENDYFGGSVSLNGDYALVGASGANEYTGAAYVFKREGATWTQMAKLTASDGAQYDGFGGSVSLNGDNALVGASGADEYMGAAYVFKREGATWTQVAKLTASAAAEYDGFGSSVAIDGDYVMVGANASNEYKGAVYLFQRSGSAWIETVKLTPSIDTEYGFGTCVSISGDYAIVGTSDSSDMKAFAVVFKRDGSSWIEVSRLPAGNLSPEGELDISVSISGDYAVAGNSNDNDWTGAVYRFKRQGSSWVKHTGVAAADGEARDFFGASVSLDNGNIIVGAYGNNNFTGSAYVYAFGGGVPAAPSITVLEPSETEVSVDGRFTIRWVDSAPSGNALISLYYDNDNIGADGTLIISGLSEDPDGVGRDEFVWNTSLIPTGFYYVYAVIDDGFNDPVVSYSPGVIYIDNSRVKIEPSDPQWGNRFGYAVAMDKDYLVVGAPDNQQGSAYVFRLSAGWSQVESLSGGGGSGFGRSVDTDGENVIVGAPFNENYRGSAYVFDPDAEDWALATLIASDGQANDFFGFSAAIDGDYAVVGAYGDDNRAGSAYVFQRDGSTWNQVAKLMASNRAARDRFGWSVAIDGEYIVVGAWGNRYKGAKDWGLAYVFKRMGSNWAETDQLTIVEGIGDYGGIGYRFGYSVAIDYPYIIVGAPGQDDEVISPGAAYIFKHEREMWREKATLTAYIPSEFDHFGYSVAIKDDHAVVGAPFTCHDGFCPGKAYAFKRQADVWTLHAKPAYYDGTPDNAVDALFGTSVAISGNHWIVGAPGDDNGDFMGKAYAYLGSRVNISADCEEVVYGDSTTLSWNALDAASVRIDPGIGEVTQKGSILVSPTQTTTYMITVTGYWGTYTDSVTVVVAPFAISIQSPSNRDFISRPDVRVEGAIRNPLGLEIGVAVNGTMAIVDGNHFVANHVLLEEGIEETGINTITVTAVDMDGNTKSDSIIVYAEEIGNYVKIMAYPESGASPLESVLRIEGTFPFADEPSFTYSGPGPIEFLERADDGYPIRIATPGLYEVTASVVDSEGKTYTDSISFEVIDVANLDALLRSKWNSMRGAMGQSNIEATLKGFSTLSKENYREMFGIVASDLPSLSARFSDIQFIKILGTYAEYDLRLTINGKLYSFFLLFAKEEDGIWRIRGF